MRWFVILLEILNHNSNSPPSQERLPITHWEPAWAGSQQSTPAWFQLSLYHCLEWDDLKTITIRKPKWVANLKPWYELPRVSIRAHGYTIWVYKALPHGPTWARPYRWAPGEIRWEWTIFAKGLQHKPLYSRVFYPTVGESILYTSQEENNLVRKLSRKDKEYRQKSYCA